MCLSTKNIEEYRLAKIGPKGQSKASLVKSLAWCPDILVAHLIFCRAIGTVHSTASAAWRENASSKKIRLALALFHLKAIMTLTLFSLQCPQKQTLFQYRPRSPPATQQRLTACLIQNQIQ